MAIPKNYASADDRTAPPHGASFTNFASPIVLNAQGLGSAGQARPNSLPNLFVFSDKNISPTLNSQSTFTVEGADGNQFEIVAISLCTPTIIRCALKRIVSVASIATGAGVAIPHVTCFWNTPPSVG